MSDETNVRKHDWGNDVMPVEPPRRLQRFAWVAIPIIIVVFVFFHFLAARREIREPVVRTRHILIKCDRYKAGDCDDAYARIKDIKEKIAAGANFAELARQFSEDETSVATGGDIGYVTRGELVEEYSETAFRMKAGDVSDIVQSSYGYHIILLLSRLDPVGWEEDGDNGGQNGSHDTHEH